MDMRVLVAFEDDYRAYRDVIAAVIQALRPRTEVQTAELGTLEEHLERFDPQLVVCSRPNTLELYRTAAWVELPTDPLQPTKVCVGGRYSEQTNPAFYVLLAVIDEVEGLIETSGDLTGC
jgi:hypothetical protein